MTNNKKKKLLKGCMDNKQQTLKSYMTQYPEFYHKLLMHSRDFLESIVRTEIGRGLTHNNKIKETIDDEWLRKNKLMPT